MSFIEDIKNLRVSEKAVVMAYIFAILEFGYILLFEVESTHVWFYVTLVIVCVVLSVLVAQLFAEYIEKRNPQLLRDYPS